MQDHFADAWVEVARRFKDHPAVIGYDIMNEPSPGSALHASEFSLTPPDGPAAEFDRTKLTQFYQRMVNAIRTVDEDNWIFYEPRYAAPANGQPSFIQKLEDSREGEPRLGYGPHLYSITTELTDRYDPESNKTLEDWEANRAIETEAQRVPLWIGEWGAYPDWVNSDLFMHDVLAL
ncbi:MAG: cellulase family glycosylhydrolase, partial [Nitrospiraceae bacterium]|nr:cellulase family glycosylhydrolase [Nitrospiraceae bacterium]